MDRNKYGVDVRRCDYELLITKAKPFDLVIMEGTDEVSQKIYSKNATTLGIIITCDVMPSFIQLKDGVFYVLESTLIYDDAMPVNYGFHLRSLLDVAKGHVKKNRAIYWCPLDSNPWDNVKNHKKIIKVVSHQIKQYTHKKTFNNIPVISRLFGCGRRVMRYMDQTEVVQESLLITNTNFNLTRYFSLRVILLLYIALGILPVNTSLEITVINDIVGHGSKSISHELFQVSKVPKTKPNRTFKTPRQLISNSMNKK
jgi:hypothetical protein